MQQGCIFCKIVDGEIPCYKIYEDNKYLAFLDKYPLADGHMLIIPKKHFEYVWDIDKIGEYFEIIQKLAKQIQIKNKQKIVYSLVHGEGVSHAHVHLFPKVDERFNEAMHSVVGQELKDSKAKKLQRLYMLDS